MIFRCTNIHQQSFNKNLTGRWISFNKMTAVFCIFTAQKMVTLLNSNFTKKLKTYFEVILKIGRPGITLLFSHQIGT